MLDGAFSCWWSRLAKGRASLFATKMQLGLIRLSIAWDSFKTHCESNTGILKKSSPQTVSNLKYKLPRLNFTSAEHSVFSAYNGFLLDDSSNSSFNK